jgi:HSP20 family protein
MEPAVSEMIVRPVAKISKYLWRWDMASIVRWDPFREMVTLREAMDSLFENAMITPQTGGQQHRMSGDLPLDVTENEDNFVVKASVPGIDPNDLDITVNGDVLTIKGEMKAEQEKQGERYHLRERRWGSFSRSISLPAPVKTDAVEADYHNGVLTLNLPKTEEVKPKRIAIRGQGTGNGNKVVEGQATQK